MKELTLLEKYEKPICLALGFFDSVHLGHRGIIEKLKECSGFYCAESAIITFSNNAYQQFNPDAKLIYTYDERITLFEKLGIECVLPFNFNRNFKEIEREEFLNSITEKYDVKAFVCGYDYLFGKNGEGNTDYLADYCKRHAVACIVVPPITVKNVRVSSSLIKTLLANGEVDHANSYLGERYFMYGEIVAGRGVGHMYDIPTANLSFLKDKLVVKNGVYATYSYIEGKKYKSVTNVGGKPTFNELSVTVESLLFDCNENLYGKQMRLEFVKMLRPIRKFDTPEILAAQIKRDINWME